MFLTWLSNTDCAADEFGLAPTVNSPAFRGLGFLSLTAMLAWRVGSTLPGFLWPLDRPLDPGRFLLEDGERRLDSAGLLIFPRYRERPGLQGVGLGLVVDRDAGVEGGLILAVLGPVGLDPERHLRLGVGLFVGRLPVGRLHLGVLLLGVLGRHVGG
jgi:hypothetical protein